MDQSKRIEELEAELAEAQRQCANNKRGLENIVRMLNCKADLTRREEHVLNTCIKFLNHP